MKKINSFEITSSAIRISSIDFFRCIAILMVMLFHFEKLLPFGDIGVDLFFIISGVLIGGILIREQTNHIKTNFFRFILQRGLKIWPSYFLFIYLGHWLMYKDLSFESNAKYIFFFQNYTGESSHLWSICVEEHFYILLPILFIVVQQFNVKYRISLLKISIYCAILFGILFKFASYYLTNSQDTFAATHNRIDGLAWGVLLSIQISQSKIPPRSLLTFLLGLFLLILSIFLSFEWFYFKKVLFHSIVPFSFFLMLRGVYYVDFSRFKIMRLIAYHSYNIFLWHGIIGILILANWGNSYLFLIIYLILSILTGIFLTITIEEPFLKIRNYLMKKYFYRT